MSIPCLCAWTPIASMGELRKARTTVVPAKHNRRAARMRKARTDEDAEDFTDVSHGRFKEHIELT